MRAGADGAEADGPHRLAFEVVGLGPGLGDRDAELARDVPVDVVGADPGRDDGLEVPCPLDALPAQVHRPERRGDQHLRVG